jgi:hypothetical protein
MFVGIFAKLVRGGFRGIIALLLGLVLLGALWSASLFRLSSRTTAIDVLTQVGVVAINPVLTRSQLGGLSQGALSSITRNCSGTAKVPGLKVAVPCDQLKSAADLQHATTAVYATVAASYYDNGIGGIFDANIPQPIVDILSGQSIVPQIPSVTAPGGQTINVPHLPNNPLLQLGSAVGFSLGTLTAVGHSEERSNMLWFGGAALVLLLLLGLTSKGGKRLTGMGHALIGGALPGVVGIALVWFLANHYAQQQAAPFQPLLGDIGGAFVPIYVGAVVAGLLLYSGALIWRLVVKPVGKGVMEAVPAAMGAASRLRSGEEGATGRGGAGGYGGYGGPPPGGPHPRYGDARPSYGQPQPPYGSPGAPQRRSPAEDPWAQPSPPPPPNPGGAGWSPTPQSPGGPGWPPSGPSPQSPADQGWPPSSDLGQTRPGWGDPPQDLSSARGSGPYGPQSPYPRRSPPDQSVRPGNNPFGQPQPPRTPQPGWSDDDGWSSRQ